MPKWVKQIIFSVIMLILMIAALYISGKEAGSMDLLYDFLILVIAIVYIVSVFCVSFDAEVRGASVFWVSLFCSVLPGFGHVVWLLTRPNEKFSFAEYLAEEDEMPLSDESIDENV